MIYPQPDPKYFDDWIQWMQLLGRSSKTIEIYKSFIKLIPEDVEIFFANSNLRSRQLKVSSYKSYLRFLTKKMKLMSRGDLLDALDNLKVPTKRGKKPKWSVPKKQWAQFIRRAPNQVAKMGAWLGFHFGLRLGEISHLRIQDINFKSLEILIQEQKYSEKNNQCAWSPKYYKERQLPFTRGQSDVIKRWIYEVRPKELDHPYLLWTPRGKYKNQIVQERTFREWTYKIDKKMHPHVLRYSFATHYYNESKNIKLISDLLGHSNVATTSEYLQIGKQETMTKARQLFAEA